MSSMAQWYLLRTKAGKERWVRDQLASSLSAVFLPMLKARTPRWGKLAVSLAPLFPCYLFARFDLAESYFEVRYKPGVSAIVSAGTDPLVVPERIVIELKSRGVDDVIEIREKPLGAGERVRIIDGPFRGFDAMFDRYLSGAERVAILLGAVQNAGLRVVLPAHAVARCS